jgi:DNA-binding IclR family transcriptional regulator
MTSPVLTGEMAKIGPWSTAEKSKSARHVKSAERTLALFELFSLHQRPMGVGEISSLLGIPQPSVSMLVRNLANLGYLERNRAAHTYALRLIAFAGGIEL